MLNRKWLLALPVGALLTFSLVQAQQNQGPGGRGGRGQGNFDPTQMRQRMLDNIKEELAASDDEWKVLQPKVEKVMEAQRETRGGGFAGFGGGPGGRGGRGGGGGRGGDNAGDRRPSDRPESKVAVAQRELRETLDNKSASSEEITRKLGALREAREKARAALQAAQKDLKELCTPRQEAVLVVSGMLD